jgi:hypothetical protein
MRTDGPSRSGQAAVEFALALFLVTLILTALIGFTPIFLKNLALQSEIRSEAGRQALQAEAGSVATVSAGPITRLTRLPASDGTGDAWAAPRAYMPQHDVFRAWPQDDMSAIRLIPAGRRQAFRFQFIFEGILRLDSEGHLVEKNAFPALQGLSEWSDQP